MKNLLIGVSNGNVNVPRRTRTSAGRGISSPQSRRSRSGPRNGQRAANAHANGANPTVSTNRRKGVLMSERSRASAVRSSALSSGRLAASAASSSRK